MKLAATFLILVVTTLTLSTADDPVSSGPGNGPSPLPGNFFERIEAIIKWFELRISVYRKANILLRQLTRKVCDLEPFNSGMDVYYRRWRDDSDVPNLKLLRTAQNETRKASISDQLMKALDEKELKFILTMMPEVYAAFHRKV